MLDTLRVPWKVCSPPQKCVRARGRLVAPQGWWHLTHGTFHPNFLAVSDFLILQQCCFFSVILMEALHKVLFQDGLLIVELSHGSDHGPSDSLGFMSCQLMPPLIYFLSLYLLISRFFHVFPFNLMP